jgi:hypothetical protein
MEAHSKTAVKLRKDGNHVKEELVLQRRYEGCLLYALDIVGGMAFFRRSSAGWVPED